MGVLESKKWGLRFGILEGVRDSCPLETPAQQTTALSRIRSPTIPRSPQIQLAGSGFAENVAERGLQGLSCFFLPICFLTAYVTSCASSSPSSPSLSSPFFMILLLLKFLKWVCNTACVGFLGIRSSCKVQLPAALQLRWVA